jgi:hypothetical protein
MMTDKRMRRNAATILLFLGALALAAALLIVLSGGFSFDVITLRDPRRPLIAGVVGLAAAWLTAGSQFPSIAQRITGTAAQLPSRIAAAASLAALVFAIAWSSRAAGGSDSSCYALQAEAFAHGQATLASPVAAALSGAPNAVFAPAGFLPSPRTFGAAVPICAPGLALAMAPAWRIRPAAVFLVVPISAALLVWLTFVLGRLVDGDETGACAAVLVACSPIFLYQAVQPMSDVPAAAAWLAALVSASPLASGVWASIALLIRPNLALLVPLLPWRKRGQPPWSHVLGAAPGVLVLLALNAVRYGSPLASGYGPTDVLFSLAHVLPNATRYTRWMIETQSPFVLLALAAPFLLRRDVARARLAWISLAAVALVEATYLAYTVFDDWWYLRFLLPALPLLLALSVAAVRALAGRASAAALTLVLSVWYLHAARDRHVTELQALEARFARAGEYAARHLPSNAVVVAGQESGGIRFHGGRDTIAWDAIPPAELDATLASLRANGRAPYFALEDGEDERFRQRFAGQRAGALDWRPMEELSGPPRVRFYAAPVAGGS